MHFPNYTESHSNFRDVFRSFRSDTTVIVDVCSIPIGSHACVKALRSRDNGEVVLEAGWEDEEYRDFNTGWWDVRSTNQIHVDPYITVEVIKGPYTKPNPHYHTRGWGWHHQVQLDSYLDCGSHIPYHYMKVRVKYDEETLEGEIRFPFPAKGTITDFDSQRAHITTEFFGVKHSYTKDVRDFNSMFRIMRQHTPVLPADQCWLDWFKHQKISWENRPTGSVKSLENHKEIKPNLDRLIKEEPFLARMFAFLHNEKTYEKVSNNKLLAAFLEHSGRDYDKLRAALRKVWDNQITPSHSSWRSGPDGRNICLMLDGASEKVEDAKAKSQWQYAKSAKAKAETLGVDPQRHPILQSKLEDGSISFALFHEPGQEDNLVNTEFDLIERAFQRKGWMDTLVKIMASASGRTTYSKRVTSYIAFLFKIERYLDKHAPRPKSGKKAVGWKAMPKFVSSQWELEMDEATTEGTTKRRSAFTPIADNDTGVITVPYVAMSVSGVRTTWCYAERYFVAEEGAEDPFFSLGGVYESDLAEKLNGRDDYGLCSFSLTGTQQNTGYPTFLIIFERTTEHGTRVHFHRVHPSRKRGPNGSATPPSRLIAECYRYMAGNVRAEEIAHQQGDLLLIKATGPGKSKETGTPVYGFENHSFEGLELGGHKEPVLLVQNTSKSAGNLLGWLHARTGMRMPHPEHEPVEGIEPGWYELRRCKSWEANPKSVWVLNID